MDDQVGNILSMIDFGNYTDQITYCIGIWTYKYTPLSAIHGIQQNISTKKTRSVRATVKSISPENDDEKEGYDDRKLDEIWQWQSDNKGWIDFDYDTNCVIVNMLPNKQVRNFKINNFLYAISKITTSFGIQTNQDTKSTRHIRAISTKKTRSPLEATIQRIDVNILPPNGSLQPNDDLFQEIATKFYMELDIKKSLDFKILRIQSIQNKFLWQSYQSLRTVHKNNIGEDKLNELYLWHGTNKEAAKSISETGFLRDYGSLMVYGRG
eukprot:70475_1